MFIQFIPYCYSVHLIKPKKSDWFRWLHLSLPTDNIDCYLFLNKCTTQRLFSLYLKVVPRTFEMCLSQNWQCLFKNLMVFVLEKYEMVLVKITSLTKNARSKENYPRQWGLQRYYACMYFQVIHCRLRDFFPLGLYVHIVEMSALGNRSASHISVGSILHCNAQSNYSILHRNAVYISTNFSISFINPGRVCFNFPTQVPLFLPWFLSFSLRGFLQSFFFSGSFLPGIFSP